VTLDALREQARLYYDARVAVQGPTPAGVDWNSQASQELRFQQLERLWERDPEATVLDYGCGYGALATYMRRKGHQGAYTGFDLSDRMVAEARRLLSQLPHCCVTTRRADLSPADYAVASGGLNVKQDIPEEDWTSYVWDVVADLAVLGRRGFAFNALTCHSDPERRRPDLFYADPLEHFEHCRSTFSGWVALLHDYPLYEFTILVRR
jgi:SAM-dependent methyltransferase